MSEKLIGDPLKILKPYLGHWDVPESGDLVLTIDEIYKEDIKNQRGTETRPVIHFTEAVKPMVLNKTNRDSITRLHGKRTERNTWQGKKIALYSAPEPKSADGFALRVRDYVPKSDEYICEECGMLVTDAEGHRAKAIANNGLTKFNKILCFDCYKAAGAALKKKEADDEEPVES